MWKKLRYYSKIDLLLNYLSKGDEEVSRIVITFLIGLLVLFLIFSSFGLVAVSDGFVSMLENVPFFKYFVDMGENFVDIETGNSTQGVSPLEDLINLVVLALVMVLAEKIIDWIMNAFGAEKTFDRFITSVNKVIWKVIITMILIVIISRLTDCLFNLSLEKVGKVSTYIISTVIIAVIVAIVFVVGVNLKKYDLKFMIFRAVVFPFIKEVTILWIYALLYLMVKTGLYSKFIPIVLGLLCLCLGIEAINAMFIKRFSMSEDRT